ncbi:hypothetical protein LN042_36555 [Kitasatospora sp. RB6PN24]|uniref:hypothetical protein n=1 Tax=Kitasatospora humi TaxID=2893891 RepID=UPI001E63C528|nr:hypothetical protein [Kitasatospora humi]MCC9312503.1 hypothetical protein [Kitasatospora humi]
MAVDLMRLRQLVQKAVRDLDFHTHRALDELCPRLALPPLPPDGSKRQRLEACLASLADEDLARTAQLFLGEERVSLSLVDRFALEDALAEAGPVVEIPGKLRREIAEALDLETLVYRADRFERLLGRVFGRDQWVILLRSLIQIIAPRRWRPAR